jgi:predicted TIM-barrel fold metal-dependent hydrolase
MRPLSPSRGRTPARPLARPLADAHRHLGVLPAYPFYGGPPVNSDIGARATIAQLMADLDAEGTERALVIPNYGVPDAAAAFAFNELCVEATGRDDRLRCGLWTSPRPEDEALTDAALALAGEPGVRALKLSFLLGGRATDPACRPALDKIFAAAERNNLVVHVHNYQAEDGEVYFTLVHGIAHECSVSFVAILQATRALRKGFESAIYFW